MLIREVGRGEEMTRQGFINAKRKRKTITAIKDLGKFKKKTFSRRKILERRGKMADA